MATKAKFDLKDIKTEATKGLHAGVGAADLAIETVKEYVSEAQKRAQKRLEAAQKDAQKAFTSAQKSVKGFEFAAANPDEASQILVDQNPGVFDSNKEIGRASCRERV